MGLLANFDNIRYILGQRRAEEGGARQGRDRTGQAGADQGRRGQSKEETNKSKENTTPLNNS